MLKSLSLLSLALSFSVWAQSAPTEVQCCAEFDLSGEISEACKNALPDTKRCKAIAAEQNKIKNAAVKSYLKESRNKSVTLAVEVLAALFLILFLANKRMNKKAHLNHVKAKTPGANDWLARRKSGINRGNFEK